MGMVVRLGGRASDHKTRPMIQNENIDRGLNHIMRLSGLRTIGNKLRYGWNTPVPGTRLTIAPHMLELRYLEGSNDGKRMPHWRSGQIMDGDWDIHTRTFQSSLKYQSCLKHFINDVPWTKTSAFPYGLKQIALRKKYDN